MTPAQRKPYFALWAAACTAQGWRSSDNTKRHEITASCMVDIKGPAVVSSNDLGEDEITALFCYLTYLSTGDSDLDAAARWIDCKQDYKAFARARQADWHEQKLYGKTSKPNKLDRNRFGGAKTAVGGPLEKFDPKAIKQRHLTLANRHQKKARAQGLPKPAAGTPSVNAPVSMPVKETGKSLASHVPASRNAAIPNLVPAEVENTSGWDGEI